MRHTALCSNPSPSAVRPASRAKTALPPTAARSASRATLALVVLAAALALLPVSGCALFASSTDPDTPEATRAPDPQLDGRLHRIAIAEPGDLPALLPALEASLRRLEGRARRTLLEARAMLVLDALLHDPHEGTASLPEGATPAEWLEAELSTARVPAPRRELVLALLDHADNPSSWFVEAHEALAAEPDLLLRAEALVLRESSRRLSGPGGSGTGWMGSCPGALLAASGDLRAEAAAELCDAADLPARLAAHARAAAPGGASVWRSPEALWYAAFDQLLRQQERAAHAGARLPRWLTAERAQGATALSNVRIRQALGSDLLTGDPTLRLPRTRSAALSDDPEARAAASAPLLLLLLRSTGADLALRPMNFYDRDAPARWQRMRRLRPGAGFALPGERVIAFAGMRTPLEGEAVAEALDAFSTSVTALEDALRDELDGAEVSEAALRVAFLADAETTAPVLGELLRNLSDAQARRLLPLVQATQGSGLRLLPLSLAPRSDARAEALHLILHLDAEGATLRWRGGETTHPAAAEAAPEAFPWATAELPAHVAGRAASRWAELAAREVPAVEIVADDLLVDWGLLVRFAEALAAALGPEAEISLRVEARAAR